MDLRGSLVDTELKIYPSEKFVNFLRDMSVNEHIPINVSKFRNSQKDRILKDHNLSKKIASEISNEDISVLKKIKESSKVDTSGSEKNSKSVEEIKTTEKKEKEDLYNNIKDGPYLTTIDLQWLLIYLQKQRKTGNKKIIYLHELLEGAQIEVPENRVLKRNPDLEARCVKLRAQQEAREYRKMTKTVDNVRMRFPEDTIAYQLKQLNRQLIAVGQFIISIFAGFLFGFRGIELMIGNLDFGFRLLLGVMCALIIALAEIYFLAKKLNEESTFIETIQLGGPPKFANQPNAVSNGTAIIKEHQD